MSVQYIAEEQRFVLETANSCYQMMVDPTGCLRHLYYGRPVGAPGTKQGNMNYLYRTTDRGFSGNPYEFQDNRGCSFDVMPQEYSCYGVGDYRIAALLCVADNGSRSTDLRFDSWNVKEGKYTLEELPYVKGRKDTVQTLEIKLKDKVTGIAVILRYGIFEEKDVITRTARICNESAQEIRLEKAASVCLDFPYGIHELISFSGRHCMERQMHRQEICQNIVTVGSKRGMSSHQNNPFVMICDPRTTEDAGECFGLMLMYSGSHMEEIEKDQTGNVRVVAGITQEGFCWVLGEGEEFQTPESILSFSCKGFNGLSQKFHRIIRENICDEKYLTEKKPVLLNSWEASYFAFDEESIYELAVEAKKLGVELLVLDDGWFGERDDDHRGLGDWFVNEKKLKGGLPALVKKINDLGLRFGLWIEPEMVNEDSSLYRSHPDWVLADPGRKPMVARNQLVLDMSRAEARDYLFDCIDRLLKEMNIEYLKWDFNRGLANVYSGQLPPVQQGEVMHRFVLGTYELLARIKKSHPDVMIEGCAGGGGRFDAGMLFYTPQIWCSDNTDPIARLMIQKGTSYGYPPCTMGSHVSSSPNHQTRRHTPLAVRGVVATSGSLGYELNPVLLSDSEKQEIISQVEWYKKNYRLIQNGTYYRLEEAGAEQEAVCWEFVSEDQSEALVNVVAANVQANAPFPYLRLKGLKEETVYRLEGSDLCLTGAALMYGGYTFEIFSGDYPAVQLHFVEMR